ncbi:MAG: transketolase [Thermoleophilaceae bacterium]|jgi:transketolase|nr:transketolase [Thermoleophilaceae bacterium]
MTIGGSQLDELSINTIRTLSMDAVEKAKSGHPGAPMALAPLAYLLYTRVMKHNPADPDWFDRDRFVLSAGHASMLLYSSLYLSGYGLTLDDLKNFRQLGSPTAGHPERGDAAGIEATTGPLGQGISMAVGLALGEAMLAARYNRPGHELIDHRTFVVASDGDMQEGVASEACSLGGHLGLGKLLVFYDNNHIQLAGHTDMAFSEDVAKRFEAYGWHVQDLGEDLALDRMEQAIDAAGAVTDQPSLVMLRTHIGFGSPNKQDSYKAHGSPLGEDEVRLTKDAYGWDPDAQFLVPDEVLDHFAKGAGERGAQAEAEWQERAEAYRAEHPDEWEELSLVIEGRLPDGWDSDLPKFQPEDGRVATRKASQDVIQWAAQRVPHLVSGSADLEPSTLTVIEDGGSVSRDNHAGRNVHYGVREHGMGAIVNGLNLHGLKAFGSTFFTFSDYMKGAMRLAALQHLPAIYVFTHDSIGLGEDGPTHQPIEQLAHLRATPNLYMVRPAGANETALAWRFALEQTRTPVAFALSRQGLPVWDPSAIPDDAIHRGAYVLRESSKEGDPDLILLGTGSEVHVCIEAADLLEADGIATRVVSAPCLERFAEQDADYRDGVLPGAVRARVSVEAASTFGWAEWTTDDGDQVGMTGFGASAPQPELYEHFGFTGESVAARGRAVLERLGART